MASELLIDKSFVTNTQLRPSSRAGGELEYRNFLAGIRPRARAEDSGSNSEISRVRSPNATDTSSETTIETEKPVAINLNKPRSNFRPTSPDAGSDEDPKKLYAEFSFSPAKKTVEPKYVRPTESSASKPTSTQRSTSNDLDSLKGPNPKSKPLSVNQLRSLFDPENDAAKTGSMQLRLFKVTHTTRSMSSSFGEDEIRAKHPVSGTYEKPSAKPLSSSSLIPPPAIKLEDLIKKEGGQQESNFLHKRVEKTKETSDTISDVRLQQPDTPPKEVTSEMNNRGALGLRKGMHGIVARRPSEFDKIAENIVPRGTTKIDVASIIASADENHNILPEIHGEEAIKLKDVSSNFGHASENVVNTSQKMNAKDENIHVGDKQSKQRSLAERLSDIVNGEESFPFSSPDYAFVKDDKADVNNYNPKHLPLRSSRSYQLSIDECFIMDLPEETSGHPVSVTLASRLTPTLESGSAIYYQPDSSNVSGSVRSVIERFDDFIAKESNVSKGRPHKNLRDEEVLHSNQFKSSLSESGIQKQAKQERVEDKIVRKDNAEKVRNKSSLGSSKVHDYFSEQVHPISSVTDLAFNSPVVLGSSPSLMESILSHMNAAGAQLEVNNASIRSHYLMAEDTLTEMTANESSEIDDEDLVSDSKAAFVESVPDGQDFDTKSKQELPLEPIASVNASLMGSLLLDLPGSSARDILPSTHPHVSETVSNASTASFQSVGSSEEFYLPPPPEKSALRKTSREERRNVNFADVGKEVILTYSPWEYDRANSEIDPIAASAEWELEKRVENMDVFSVDLNKDERGLGLSIIGLGVGTETGVEKLGIFVKTLTPNGAAEKDGRIQVNDQILEVNGVSLVGVTQQFAAFTLKGTSGTVRFLMGREKSRRMYFPPGSTGTNSDVRALEQKHIEELNELITQLQEMEERALAAENTADEVKFTLLQTEEKAHAWEAQVKDLQEKMTAMAESPLTVGLTQRKLKNEIKKGKNSKDKSDKVDELQRSLQEISVRLSASEENLLAMQASSDEKEQGIVELEVKLRQTEDDLKQVEARNVGLTREVHERDTRLAELEERFEKQHVDHSDLTRQLDVYKEKYQRLAQELEVVRAATAHEDLMAKYSLLEEVNQSLVSEAALLRSINEKLEQQAEERDELVSKLNAENEYLQKLIIKLERSDAQAASSVDVSRKRAEEQEEKIKQLQEKIRFLEHERAATARRRFFDDLSPVIPDADGLDRAGKDGFESDPMSGDSGVTEGSFERPAVPKRQVVHEEFLDEIVPAARLKLESAVPLPPEISRDNKPHLALENPAKVAPSSPEGRESAVASPVSAPFVSSSRPISPVKHETDFLTSSSASVEEDHLYLTLVDTLEQSIESDDLVVVREEASRVLQPALESHTTESAEPDDGDFGVVPYVEDLEDEDDWAIVKLEDAVDVANPVPKPPRHYFVGVESKATPESRTVVEENELTASRSEAPESTPESDVRSDSVRPGVRLEMVQDGHKADVPVVQRPTGESPRDAAAISDKVADRQEMSVHLPPKSTAEPFQDAAFSSSAEPGVDGSFDRRVPVAASAESKSPEMAVSYSSNDHDAQLRKTPVRSFLSSLPETKVDSESEDDTRWEPPKTREAIIEAEEPRVVESLKEVSDMQSWLNGEWKRLAEHEREEHAEKIAASIASSVPVLRKASFESLSDDDKKLPTAVVVEELDDDKEDGDVRWTRGKNLDESYLTKSKVVLSNSFEEGRVYESDVDGGAKKEGVSSVDLDSVLPITPVLDSQMFREKGVVAKREDRRKPSAGIHGILASESDAFQLSDESSVAVVSEPPAERIPSWPAVDGPRKGLAPSGDKEKNKQEKHKRFAIHLPKVFKKGSRSAKRSSNEHSASASTRYPPVLVEHIDPAVSVVVDESSGGLPSGADDEVVPFEEKAAASSSLERLNDAATEEAVVPFADKEAAMLPSGQASYQQPSKNALGAAKLRETRANTFESKISRLAAEAELKAAVSSPDLSQKPNSSNMAAAAGFSRSTNALDSGVNERGIDVHFRNGASDDERISHWTGKPPNEWDVRQVGLWLVEINMGQYVNSFKTANIDGQALVKLDGNKLKELGVLDQSHRTDIKRHAKKYRHSFSDDSQGKGSKRGRKLKFWKGKYAVN